MNRPSMISFFKRLGTFLLGVGFALVIAVLVCEALGWPFLVEPVQRKLASSLGRHVELGGASHAVQIRVLGSVRVRASRIEIGAPEWSSEPHTFLASDVAVRLTYGDLWRVYRTGRLRIDDLEAEQFDMQLERLRDGRASWEFKVHQPAADGSTTDLPAFGRLRVASGTLRVKDAKTPLDIDARYSLSDGSGPMGAAPVPSATPPSASQSDVIHGLRLTATGHYKSAPLQIEAESDGILMLEGQSEGCIRQPLRLQAVLGTAKMAFAGSVLDPLHFSGLQGRFEASGPSLDAAGEPLGVTLPVTPKFGTAGTIAKDGNIWKAVFDYADLGASKLSGAFTFDKRGKVPLLSGRLLGLHLALSDLGPAIGRVGADAGGPGTPASDSRAGKAIPNHPFDLPSLRVMNANVLIDIDDLDLGTTVLEPLRPARAHLTLDDGVLRLDDLEARTARGELSGMLALDGRNSPAIWRTDMRVRGLELAQWLHQKRGEGDPPYISGKLDGQAKVKGTGRSVAEILGGMNGDLRFHLTDASLSHLALKAAGLDIAGGLKVLLKGDEVLPIHCNVADLSVSNGVVHPKVFVVSLDNATIWADGQISLKDEQLDVRAVSAPKDFSPFTVRTPIDVKGSLSKPKVSVEAKPIVARAGAAVLLGLLNPLAAVIPFVDPGARGEARKEDGQCAALLKRVGMK